ncbi:transposase family protein [Streptomyces sp. NBC_00638]|uniref:transposase family protein n=1 Tax=Streptomyces sp. NBC_00638 TaxID=2975794 RepID=UPI00225414C6|nr:transposase family protein [Streptomyces sp. NBC_00638]MCX5008623.1 transposase family protein [Streptomyces sp. NBC_00638]
MARDRKDRDKFVSGKPKQNAVKSMVFTDAQGRVLFCSPVQPGSCADITQARQLGLAHLPADGSFMEILADAGYQGIGAQMGGRVVSSKLSPVCSHTSRPPPSAKPLEREHRQRHTPRRAAANRARGR